MGTVFAAFIDEADNDNIVVKQQGLASGGDGMASVLPLVAFYVKYEDTPTNFVWLRYKGVDAVGCRDNTVDGTTIVYSFIKSGQGSGTKIREFVNVGDPSDERSAESGTEEIVASGALCWDVFNGGAGGPYTTALAAADTAVGFPG